jgi:hypothetical protein
VNTKKKDETDGNAEVLQPYPIVAADALPVSGTTVFSAAFVAP